MIAAFNRIVKKDIVKIFSLTAISTIVRMFTGFISIKVVSAIIGPAGIALLGQLNNFASILLTISTGGINNGVTKYVAEYSTSKNKINMVLRTALFISSLMSILTGLTLIVFSSYFSKVILNDTGYSSLITIFGFTIIFYSLNALLVSILNGFKEFKKIVIISISSSVASLLLTILLAFFFGIYGALLSAVTFESISLLVTLSIISKNSMFELRDFFGKFSKKMGKKLSNYSLMALVSAATVPVSQLIVRSNIVRSSSLTDAGLWEAMNRLSAMYLLVITSSLSIYYLPRLSEIKNDSELRREIFNAYKFIIPPLIIITSTIFLLRNFIIDIVFNDKFQEMENLFALQLIGDFFKITSWILAFQMVAKSMTFIYISTEVLSTLIYILMAVYLIKFYGNWGATLGYALGFLIYFLAMVVIFRKLIFRRVIL